MTNAVLVALQLVAGATPCHEQVDRLAGHDTAVLALRPAYVQVCTNRCDYCKAWEAYRQACDGLSCGDGAALTVLIEPPKGKCACLYRKDIDRYDLVPIGGSVR